MVLHSLLKHYTIINSLGYRYDDAASAEKFILEAGFVVLCRLIFLVEDVTTDLDSF
jgi:hypothetical protein